MTKTSRFGTVIHDGKEYTLQAQPEVASTCLPAPYTNHAEAREGEGYDFEVSALAIGPDDAAYQVTWIFFDIKGQEPELDAYTYDDVHGVEPADLPVFLVQLVRGTDQAFDETHTPQTIYRTLDLREIKKVADDIGFEQTKGADLDGRPYYLEPVVIEVWGDERKIIEI